MGIRVIFKIICSLESLSIILFLIGCGGEDGGSNNSGVKGNDYSEPTVSICGRVLDSDGTPVPSAEVAISSDPVVVTTDPNGQFTANVPPGDHEITISRNDVGFHNSNFTAQKGSPVNFGDLSPTVFYTYMAGEKFTVPIADIILDGNESDWQNVAFLLDENTKDDQIATENITGEPDIAFIKIATDSRKSKLFFLIKLKNDYGFTRYEYSSYPKLEILMDGSLSSNNIIITAPYVLHWTNGLMIGAYEVSVINESTGKTVEDIAGYYSAYYIEFCLDTSNINLNDEYTISGKATAQTYWDNFNFDAIMIF